MTESLVTSARPCSCGNERAWETADGPRCYACMTKTKRSNKYGATRWYSEKWQRWFASTKEGHRADYLGMLNEGGVISNLMLQVVYVLSEKPRVSAVIDFRYVEDGRVVLEDAKGIDRRTGKPVTLTRAAKAKYAWLKEKYGLTVRIV